MRGDDNRYNRYCALKPRKHTKPLRSAGEVAVRSPNLQRSYFCSETNCKTVQKWTGARLDKFIVEQQNGKFLDVIAQRIWIRFVRTVLPI